MVPLILVRCIPSKSFPKSVVKVTSISGPLPPMFMRPTDDSGFACVFAENMRFTASAWASHLEGLVQAVSALAIIDMDPDNLHIIAISATLAIVHPKSMTCYQLHSQE